MLTLLETPQFQAHTKRPQLKELPCRRAWMPLGIFLREAAARVFSPAKSYFMNHFSKCDVQHRNMSFIGLGWFPHSVGLILSEALQAIPEAWACTSQQPARNWLLAEATDTLKSHRGRRPLWLSGWQGLRHRHQSSAVKQDGFGQMFEDVWLNREDNGSL